MLIVKVALRNCVFACCTLIVIGTLLSSPEPRSKVIIFLGTGVKSCSYLLINACTICVYVRFVESKLDSIIATKSGLCCLPNNVLG